MDDNIFIKRIFAGKSINFPHKKVRFNFLENLLIVLFIVNQMSYATSTPIERNNNRNNFVKLKHSGLRNHGRRVIIKQEEGGCYHNGTNFAENSYVPTMEPCLICKCANRTLICALRICPDQPIPPPRGCVLIHGKRSCCPHISCTKINYHVYGKNQPSYHNNHFHESTDHHKRHIESDQLKRSDDFDVDPFERASLGICVENGTVYQSGSAMSSSSLCSYCYCIDGRQKCVKPKCMLKQNGYTPIFVKGSCCPVRYDCLNKRESNDKSNQPNANNNNIRGTIKYKGTRSPRAGGCFINSINYQEGQKLPVDEAKPCDICFCIRGERKCTPKMCAPSLQNCLPIVKTGECCAASYDCNRMATVKSVIVNSNQDTARQFDFFSILFGLDEPQNSTTLSTIAYPEDRTPPEVSMAEIDDSNETESEEDIEEIDDLEENMNEETTNQDDEVINSTSISPIPTTTEKNFFDIIREGLNMIDNNGDKIGMIIDETTPSKLRPQIPISTTKKPPNDNNQSLLDLLLGPDDDEEYEEWKHRNKNKTNFDNVTKYPPFSPQPPMNHFPTISYSEDDEHDRIKYPPRPPITAFPSGLPFMNSGRFPPSTFPPIKETTTHKFTVEITQPTTTSTSTTTTTTTTTTTPKPSTSTTKTTTTPRSTSTPTTTTTKKLTTTRPSTTVTTPQTTSRVTTQKPTPLNRTTSSTTTTTTTSKPSTTMSTTVATKPPITITTTIKAEPAKPTVKPYKQNNQSFSVDVNTSFKLNTNTNHSKPMQTQYIKSNDSLFIIHEDIPPLVLSSGKSPGFTKVISPVVDSDDYSYNDFSGKPTLPPSLPNLKIIPFLPTDAVKNDRKKVPVLTAYNTETENYDSLIDKRIDYEIDNPFGINFMNKKYQEHDVGSNLGDGVLDKDPTNPQSLLKPEKQGYGEYTESPFEYRFSPPTKTEGGFRPREPDRDDNYFYNSAYHTTFVVNLTTETPKQNATTPNSFNNVLKTEPAPNLLSLIEDKEKLLAKNYTDISLYDDTDDDIISITTDVNYNNNNTNLESSDNTGFFGNVLSFLFNSDNKGNNDIVLQSNSDVLRNYTSGLASGQANVTKTIDTVIPPFKILPKVPANNDFRTNSTIPKQTSSTTMKTTTTKRTTMNSIAPVTRTTTKLTTTTNPPEKVLAVYSMDDGNLNRKTSVQASPKIDNINLLFPHHEHHHNQHENNYHVLDDLSISNTESYVVNPVDASKLKDRTSGQAEIFTKPNSNSLASGFGILKLAGCNIYGRMYRVGKIISELSGPCLECKCTDIGVNCTPLSC